MSAARVDVITFATDPQLLNLTLSTAQEVVLRGFYGLPLQDTEQRAIWEQVSGGRAYREGHEYPELVLCAGARAGKDSRILQTAMTYEMVTAGYEQELHRGERGIVPILFHDAKSAAIGYAYMLSSLQQSPMLRSLIAEEPLKQSVRLTNGIELVCFPCTARSVRGWSIPCAAMSETAHWSAVGSNDEELLAAVRRGTVGFRHPKLVRVSTPFAKAGLLWREFQSYYGQDDPNVLFLKADSALMNPSLTDRLEREREIDPVRYRREYLAEFLDDQEAFLSSDWIDACIDRGIHERQPQRGQRYFAAVDVSGGTGGDAFVVSICHMRQGEREERRPIGKHDAAAQERRDRREASASRVVVQDVCRGWAKSRGGSVDLEATVREAATLLRKYAISEVWSDSYAAGWAKQAWERAGVKLIAAPGDRTACFLAAEPAIVSGTVRLLDHEKQEREARELQRTNMVGGRVRIDHPKRRDAHDDHILATCMCVAGMLQARDKRSRRVVGTPELSFIVSSGECMGGGAPFTAAGLAPKLTRFYL